MYHIFVIPFGSNSWVGPYITGARSTSLQSSIGPGKLPGKNDLSVSVAPCGEKSLSPAGFLEQGHPARPWLKGPGKIVTYKGKTYFETWHYQEALSSYEEAIERYPNAAGAYCGKGDVHWKLECPEEALSAYEDALRLDPQRAAAARGKGWIFHNQKRDEEALAAFEQALQFDSACYDAYTGKRSALKKLERHEEALTTSRNLVALCQQKQLSLSADAYYAQSLALLHLKHRDEAMRIFEQCIYHYPGYLDAYE